MLWDILGWLIFALGLFCLALFIRYTLLSFGYRKKNLAKVRAYLKHTDLRHNVYQKADRKWHKNWIHFTYAYRIDGIAYTVSGEKPGVRGDLNTSETVCYQKNRPQLSYIPALTYPQQPILAAISLLAAFVCSVFGWLCLLVE